MASRLVVGVIVAWWFRQRQRRDQAITAMVASGVGPGVRQPEGEKQWRRRGRGLFLNLNEESTSASHSQTFDMVDRT